MKILSKTDRGKQMKVWKTHSQAANNNTSNDGFIKISHDRED